MSSGDDEDTVLNPPFVTERPGALEEPDDKVGYKAHRNCTGSGKGDLAIRPAGRAKIKAAERS